MTEELSKNDLEVKREPGEIQVIMGTIDEVFPKQFVDQGYSLIKSGRTFLADVLPKAEKGDIVGISLSDGSMALGRATHHKLVEFNSHIDQSCLIDYRLPTLEKVFSVVKKDIVDLMKTRVVISVRLMK